MIVVFAAISHTRRHALSHLACVPYFPCLPRRLRPSSSSFSPRSSLPSFSPPPSFPDRLLRRLPYPLPPLLLASLSSSPGIDPRFASHGPLGGQAPREYAFRHHFVRTAIYTLCPASQRRKWHRRMAEILRSSPDQVHFPLLAYHYQHADMPDDAYEALVSAAMCCFQLASYRDGIGFIDEARKFASTESHASALIAVLSDLMMPSASPIREHRRTSTVADLPLMTHFESMAEGSVGGAVGGAVGEVVRSSDGDVYGGGEALEVKEEKVGLREVRRGSSGIRGGEDKFNGGGGGGGGCSDGSDKGVEGSPGGKGGGGADEGERGRNDGEGDGGGGGDGGGDGDGASDAAVDERRSGLASQQSHAIKVESAAAVAHAATEAAILAAVTAAALSTPPRQRSATGAATVATTAVAAGAAASAVTAAVAPTAATTTAAAVGRGAAAAAAAAGRRSSMSSRQRNSRRGSRRSSRRVSVSIFDQPEGVLVGGDGEERTEADGNAFRILSVQQEAEELLRRLEDTRHSLRASATKKLPPLVRPAVEGGGGGSLVRAAF